MTDQEFQKKLEQMYGKYSFISKSKQKTFNELVYVLRMSEENWQINTTCDAVPNGFSCYPGVKDVFIPAKALAQKVVSVEFDEETWEEHGVRLLLVKVED